MSGFVRTLQKRIFERAGIHTVPIIDNQAWNIANRDRIDAGEVTARETYRVPFSRQQIAFIGNRRIMPGDKDPRFQPMIDLLEQSDD